MSSSVEDIPKLLNTLLELLDGAGVELEEVVMFASEQLPCAVHCSHASAAAAAASATGPMIHASVSASSSSTSRRS